MNSFVEKRPFTMMRRLEEESVQCNPVNALTRGIIK